MESVIYRLAILRQSTHATGETHSLTVTLLKEQRIEVPEPVVRWSRGQEFGIETVETPKHTADYLIHYVRLLVNDSA